MNRLIKKSIEFLETSKDGIIVESHVQDLKKMTLDDLLECLINDKEKKIFWINMYNAFIQIYGKAGLPNFEGKELKFFNIKLIEIAGMKLSFNDIEHGILRKSQWVYVLGDIPKWFVSSREKSIRVDELDYRIHFLLNCGAVSCPMIYELNEQNIESQLDEAEKEFIHNEVELNHAKKSIHASKIFQFYLGDFGGRKGMKKLIGKQLGIDLSSYNLIFKDYNWSLKMGNFKKYETKVISN
jgi:hypothetical protein